MPFTGAPHTAPTLRTHGFVLGLPRAARRAAATLCPRIPAFRGAVTPRPRAPASRSRRVPGFCVVVPPCHRAPASQSPAPASRCPPIQVPPSQRPHVPGSHHSLWPQKGRAQHRRQRLPAAPTLDTWRFTAWDGSGDGAAEYCRSYPR